MGGWTTVHRVQRAHLALCGPVGRVLVHCGHGTYSSGEAAAQQRSGLQGRCGVFHTEGPGDKG